MSTTTLSGLAVLSHQVALWQVFVLGAVSGTFSAADNPARQAFVSEVDRALTDRPADPMASPAP
jgi:histone acetyltransferase (RNA polymerase elongator complex component)